MSNSQLQPPYVSFGIFKSTLDTLAQSTVPSSPIDRRVLDGLSGADFGALMSALKFLGLVTEDRKATQHYRELVRASTNPETFKIALGVVIKSAYKPIAHVDIEHGTIAELERAFREIGVSPGQMLTKTVRFYLKALAECGVSISPHITKASKTPRTPAPKTGNGPQPRKKKPRVIPDDASDVTVTPKGYERLPIPGLPGAHIQYPSELTAANCDLFDAMVGVLRAYVKGRSGGKEKKS